MSKIVLTNNGTVAQSIMNHGAGRVLVPAGESVTITLDHAKDQVSGAYLEKFYNQYADVLDVELDIADYPLQTETDDEPEVVSAPAQEPVAAAKATVTPKEGTVDVVAEKADEKVAAKKSTK